MKALISYSLGRAIGALASAALLVLVFLTGASFGATAQSSAGATHSLFLHSDGTLWASGMNQFGQLGDGSFVSRNALVQIGSAHDWMAVSAGSEHSLALKANGTLWSWGRNNTGQLGKTANGLAGGTPAADQNAPVQIGTGRDWVAVAASTGGSSFALKADGTLWAWGDNASGQLGVGDTAQRTVPVQVPNPGTSGFVAVACGAGHTLALQADGSLWSWGANNKGQLGSGTSDALAHATPQQVVVSAAVSDNDWKGVSAGDLHSLALKGDGTLWAWGDNIAGELGQGFADQLPHATPQQVGSDRDWRAVSAGAVHSLALKRNGSVWGFGDDRSGQLGDGGVAAKSAPVRVGAALADVVSISAGAFYSLVAKGNGEIYAFGDNGIGQFGNGTNAGSPLPVLAGRDTVAWVASEPGNQFTVARRSNGTLWGWGDNASGQLGDSFATPRSAPAQVGSADNWVAQAAGLLHTVALRADGTLWSWGDNSAGQLGDGTTNARPVPRQIVSTLPSSAPDNWAALAAGDVHTLALKGDGTLWAWGDNTSGQLGDGSTAQRTEPVQVVTGIPGDFDSHWVAIAAGGSHSLGLQADGTLWAWGGNESGQLGDPLFGASVSTPSQVVNFSPPTAGYNSNWTALAAGLSHSLALQADGTLWAFGSNFSGQLGNADAAAHPADQGVPVQVSGALYAALAAGDSYSAARRADGTLWSWGNNTSGQLGIGSTDPDQLNPVAHAAPQQVGAASDWMGGGTGGSHSVFLNASGFLYAWGSNQSGQLGDGTTFDGNLPAALPEALIEVPSSLAFNAVAIGASPGQGITVVNRGSATLVFSAAVSGGSGALFAVNPGSCGTAPFSLAAGKSCQLQIVFTPALPQGAKAATLAIDSNDPVRPTATVSLSGSAAVGFTVTTAVSPAGSGSISPQGPVLALPGSSSTFVITPAAGYHVSDVKVNGVSKGAVSSVTLPSISADAAVSATFAPDTFSVTLAAGTNGSISGPGTANFGATPSYSIVPNAGFHVTDVTVNGVSKGALTTLTLAPLSGSVTIAASFAINSYSIALNPGAHGSISGPVTVPHGATATYAIVPDAGSYVIDVAVDGISRGAVTALTLPAVAGDHIVSASFGVTTFAVSSSGDARGNISPFGTVQVAYGSSQTFTFAPNAGYQVVEVLVDGVSQGAVSSITLTNVVSGGHTVAVSFTPDGDMNGDRTVDVSDALLALRVAVGLITPTPAQLRHGDVAPLNQSGIPQPDNGITVGDALVTLKKAVGLTSGF